MCRQSNSLHILGHQANSQLPNKAPKITSNDEEREGLKHLNRLHLFQEFQSFKSQNMKIKYVEIEIGRIWVL